MRFRSVLTAVLTTAAALGGLAAVAQPAAALPTCLGMSVYSDSVDQYERPTTVDNSRNTNCVLGVGSRGEPVIYLQLALNRCYGQGIGVDGVYGTQTRNAVRNVQAFHRLTVDGVFGPQTSRVMFWPYYHYDDRCHLV